MNDRLGLYAATALSCLLFLGVQLGALALIEPFIAAEMQAVEDPEDPTYSVLYIFAILVATAFMLAAFKYNYDWVIRLVIVGVSVMLAWFVFAAIIPPIMVSGILLPIPLLGALAVGAALLRYPEWYVIDTAGVVMGAGAAGIFGISLGLLPVLILLVVLAVYDAISVYRTKHMLDLASGVMDLRIPVVLVIPTTLSYSFLASENQPDTLEDGEESAQETDGGAETSVEGVGTEEPATEPSESLEDGEHGDTTVGDELEDSDSEATGDQTEDEPPEPARDALFIGLGDAVIPTILVASAVTFLEAPLYDLPVIALNTPALGAMIGTLAGLLTLLYMVVQGRAHAGLPLLNAGAIGGYLLGAVLIGIPVTTALGL